MCIQIGKGNNSGNQPSTWNRTDDMWNFMSNSCYYHSSKLVFKLILAIGHSEKGLKVTVHQQ